MTEADEHLKFAEMAAAEYLAKLEDLVKTALDSRIVPSNEKTDLTISISRIRNSMGWFRQYVITPILITSPDSAAHIYEHLWNILSSAIIVGSSATVSYAAENFATSKHAKTARDAATKKRAELNSAIETVLINTDQRSNIRVSVRFAGQIRPLVLDQLGVAEKKGNSVWPSVSTIKDALRELKQDSS
jgi:hypothetical protein